jgi:hypothetical protein
MTIYATGMLRDAPESAKPLASPGQDRVQARRRHQHHDVALIKTRRVKSVNIGRRRLVIYSLVGIITGA